MSNGDGDGEAAFVTRDTLRSYQNNQTELCSVYRRNMEIMIRAMETNITSQVRVVGSILGIIVTILTVINVYISVVM